MGGAGGGGASPLNLLGRSMPEWDAIERAYILSGIVN